MASNTVKMSTDAARILAKEPGIKVGATNKTFDGTTSISFSMNEIMGSSDSTKFYRGDKTWSNTLTGQLVLSGYTVGDCVPALKIQTTTAATTWNYTIDALVPGMTNGQRNKIAFGKVDSAYNQAGLVYNHVGDGSTSNYISLGFHSNDFILNILANGNVGIKTTTPAYPLEVNGLINGFSFKCTGTAAINANDLSTGIWVHQNSATNAATTNHGMLIGIGAVSTPAQLFISDTNVRYIYKRYYSGGWSSWFKLDAGNADTATTLQTARTITIGNTGKSFNGSANVSWSHDEIHVLPFHKKDATAASFDTYTDTALRTIYSTGNTSQPLPNHGVLFTAGSDAVGTPFQIFIGDTVGADTLYIWKRLMTGSWSKMSAGYADKTGILNTARSLWGNSFNGSADINGNITISHATSATMTADSTNPKITFAESGSQPVHLIYTDYDSYRAPAGLKVVGGASASPAWFEVEGNLIAASATIAGFNIQVTTSVNANTCSQGLYIVAAAITNAPTTNHGMLLYVSSVGTPFQMFFPDNQMYVYKRYYSGGAWTSWSIMGAAWL